MRTDANGNAMGGIVRFYTFLSDAAVEATRIHLTADGMRGFLDLLAKMVKHYPTKESTDSIATSSSTPT
jgi:hypothetical protein